MLIWSERSLNVRTTAWSALPFWYQGREYALAELAPATGANKLFLQSCFPMWTPSEYDSLSNAKITDYNERLRGFCAENGFVFVDLADYFRGEDGGIAEEFTSDHYVHINMAAAQLWVEQLRNPLNYSVDPRSF